MNVPEFLKTILLIGGFALPFFSILFTFIKDRKENNTEKKSNQFTNILFFCGLIGVIFSGLGTYVSETEKKQAEDSARNIRAQDLNFQGTIDSLSKENLQLLKSNTALAISNNNKLIQEYQGLQKLSAISKTLVDSLNTSLQLQQVNSKALNELFKQTIGDSTIPTIMLFPNPTNPKTVKVTLNNLSNYPISNISVYTMYPAKYTPIDPESKLDISGNLGEIISSAQPLTLLPRERNHVIDVLHLDNLGRYASQFPAIRYLVKWRNGSYVCTIPMFNRDNTGTWQLGKVTYYPN